MGLVLMILFWAAVIVGLVFLVRYIVAQGRGGSVTPRETALDVLARRYANGEVDRAEFEQKRRDLEDIGRPPRRPPPSQPVTP